MKSLSMLSSQRLGQRWCRVNCRKVGLIMNFSLDTSVYVANQSFGYQWRLDETSLDGHWPLLAKRGILCFTPRVVFTKDNAHFLNISPILYYETSNKIGVGNEPHTPLGIRTYISLISSLTALTNNNDVTQ